MDVSLSGFSLRRALVGDEFSPRRQEPWARRLSGSENSVARLQMVWSPSSKLEQSGDKTRESRSRHDSRIEALGARVPCSVLPREVSQSLLHRNRTRRAIREIIWSRAASEGRTPPRLAVFGRSEVHSQKRRVNFERGGLKSARAGFKPTHGGERAACAVRPTRARLPALSAQP